LCLCVITVRLSFVVRYCIAPSAIPHLFLLTERDIRRLLNIGQGAWFYYPGDLAPEHLDIYYRIGLMI
ncbi:hypothetical protein V6O07_08890, partial [Arthrospira platensis SPKY2]